MTEDSDRDFHDRLYVMHWDQKQSLHLMARNLNISMRTLARTMTRLGVPRRSYAEAMVLKSRTAWVTKDLLSNLYWGKRLSTSQVGEKLGLDHATVLELMNRFSIPRRTTSQAGMKYDKHPFSDDPLEACYLLGFRSGDLHAAMYGLQVRLSTSSTHPAMSKLFTSLFAKYGRVGKSPSLSEGRYMWLNYCYLDRSFEFLLKKPSSVPEDTIGDQRKFLAFFAGYVDAEGNFRIYQQDHAAAYSFRINSEDEVILRQSSRALKAMGYHAYFELQARPSDTNRFRRNLWSLGMFRKAEIISLLKRLPLFHEEKIRWRRLMTDSADENWDVLKPKVVELRASIKAEVAQYCQLAEAEKGSAGLKQG